MVKNDVATRREDDVPLFHLCNQFVMKKFSWCLFLTHLFWFLSSVFFWVNLADQKQVWPCCISGKNYHVGAVLAWLLALYGEVLTVRCLLLQIRFPLFPHWISPRPRCLAKHSWLNVRHEPSCQEKAGGGVAGLGQPQFGISLLFVIHTEQNESRCRSIGESGEREGGKQSSKTRCLSGNRYCRNKSKAIFVKQYGDYTEQAAEWGFN